MYTLRIPLCAPTLTTIPITARPVLAAVHAARCTLGTQSGRIRWYLERLFSGRNRNVTARLDRRAAQSTCVCQAKSLKRPRIKKYSGRAKRHLPHPSSFSGPGYPGLTERFTSVSQNGFRAVSLLSRNVFQAKCHTFSYGILV